MKVREITKKEEWVEVINLCQVCHVGMVDSNGHPYVVPMNFGFRDGVIYLHSAQHGKKMDILRERPQVSIAFSSDYLLRYQNEEVACSYGMKYRSVMAFGSVSFIEDNDEKIDAMNVVMKQYTGKEFPYNMPAIREVCVYILNPDLITGRAYGM